jgi:hypothetical protein
LWLLAVVGLAAKAAVMEWAAEENFDTKTTCRLCQEIVMLLLLVLAATLQMGGSLLLIQRQ